MINYGNIYDMTGLIFSFLAASCATASNLAFRKNALNSNSQSTPSGYLVLFYSISFILSLICFEQIWVIKVNYTLLAIGGVVGLLNVILMFLTSKALKLGPSGLTFAFQNASAIFPGIVLFFIFGNSYGYSCSYLQMGGMALVLIGLFLGAKVNLQIMSKRLIDG